MLLMPFHSHQTQKTNPTQAHTPTHLHHPLTQWITPHMPMIEPLGSNLSPLPLRIMLSIKLICIVYYNLQWGLPLLKIESN